MSSSEAQPFLTRLDAVERRLMQEPSAPAHALTSPDPSTREQWDGGQVWAHLTEFIPYWLAQIRAIFAASSSQPVPFGRTKADEGRIAAIARDRSVAQSVLRERLRGQIAELRAFLQGLDDASWRVQGRHPTLGVMDLSKIIDEFLVGHLEQHADQLDSLKE